jgi:hypothetical protein
MDVFLELLSCDYCVDIQHHEVYNILSNAASLDERDNAVLFRCHITVYNARHYASFLTYIGRKL